MVVLAVTGRRDRETARHVMRSLDLKTVSRFVQAAVMLLGIAVLIRGKEDEEIDYKKRKAVLSATGKKLVVCVVQRVIVFSVWAHVENGKI